MPQRDNLECQNRMKMDLKKEELFLHYVEHLPHATQDFIPFVGHRLGMKTSSIELFFTSATSTENKEDENVSNERR